MIILNLETVRIINKLNSSRTIVMGRSTENNDIVVVLYSHPGVEIETADDIRHWNLNSRNNGVDYIAPKKMVLCGDKISAQKVARLLATDDSSVMNESVWYSCTRLAGDPAYYARLGSSTTREVVAKYGYE